MQEEKQILLLDFCKVSNTVPQYPYRQTEEGLDKMPVILTETWLNCLAHTVVTSA